MSSANLALQPDYPALPSPAPAPSSASTSSSSAVVILPEPFLFVVVAFRGVPLSCHLLSALADDRGRHGRLTVGMGKRAQAPADPAFFMNGARASGQAQTDHDLLTAEGAGFRLELPPAARLTATAEEGVPARAIARAECPRLMRLGPEGWLRVELGDISVEISRAEAQSVRALALGPAAWLLDMSATEAASHGASFLFLLMWMLIFRLMPPDSEALTFDLLSSPRHLPPWALIPVQLPPLQATGPGREQDAGSRDPEKTTAAVGSRRPANARTLAPRIQVPRAGSPTSSEEAISQARAAGLLGRLRPDNAAWAAVVGHGDPFGAEAADVLSDLRGPVVAGDLAPGGLWATGTGRKGGGTGGGLEGGGGGLLASIKDGAMGGGDRGYGRAVGGLPPKHHVTTIDVVPCATSAGCSVVGSLSSEIIRRTIRRHINEIRYCYEQALPRKPSLAGRLAVSFVILPNGTVTAAALAQDTLSDARTSSCVLDAARRWSFPQPEGGGLVKVSYPFTFAPAGAQTEAAFAAPPRGASHLMAR